jgi:hypothetical protein
VTGAFVRDEEGRTPRARFDRQSSLALLRSRLIQFEVGERNEIVWLVESLRLAQGHARVAARSSSLLKKHFASVLSVRFEEICGAPGPW